MANIEPHVIRQLLLAVEKLERELKGVNRMKRDKSDRRAIKEIGSELDGAAALDEFRWRQLDAEKQKRLLRQLTVIHRDLLEVRGARAGQQSSYLMHDNGVSRASIIWLTVFGFIFAATLLSLIR